MSESKSSSPPSGGPVITTPPVLTRALRHVLRPLVRLMLGRGINYPYLAELLKGLFVEVADKEFRLDGKKPTDSRINLLTGVHRKDVSRLRMELDNQDDDIEPGIVSLGAQLVARWLGSPEYLDATGKAKPLTRFASEGGGCSFEALVASVSSDIRSRVVLDEWLRLGVAHLDDENRVCLNAEAFVPTKGFEEKVFYFGHNLHDHAAAAVSNLLDTQNTNTEIGVPFIERSVYYDELSISSVKQLATQGKTLGMKTLLAMNKSALEAEARDRIESPNEPRQRMTFGIYFYAEPANQESGNRSNEGGKP